MSAAASSLSFSLVLVEVNEFYFESYRNISVCGIMKHLVRHVMWSLAITLCGTQR